MDVMIYYYILGGIIACGMCWLIGRCMDLSFRQWLMRIITKKDLGILALTDKTKKRILHIPVDFSSSTLVVDKYLWIFDKRHLYVKEKKELGFFVKDTMLKFEEGIPVLYVDRDSVMPSVFNENEDPVKPQEIYAGIKAWIDNERAKLMATANILRTLQMLLVIAMVFSIISAGVSYMAMQSIQKVDSKVDVIMDNLGIDYNATIQAQKGK